MADVLIRNLSPETIKMLDRLAKEKKYKSRNEYLRALLEDMTFLEKNSALLERMEKQLMANTLFMQENQSSIDKLISIISSLLIDETEELT